ncbi:uncharacterized protein JCM6883_004262 [Sporobolomyces salmoneus]|uniref:uncharacterized protein n=1 Tax=Sporobolomyces salmoneus TaxID=183962 RepID=UPI00317C7D20
MASELSSIVRSFYSSRQGKVNILDLRSIGTICTALERRDPKKALLDCQTLLKRRPNEPSALTLKAVAISLGSKPLTASSQNDFNKAFDAVQSLNNGTALGDADIVMALSYALRNLGKNTEAVELLTRAAKENSDNEELAQEAFVQMIRLNEISKAQQLSIRMSGTFSSNPDYTLWSIMTVILQIRDLRHPQTDLLLSLAERQATKYFESHDEYKTADEFHVVSRLLELRAQLATSFSASPFRSPVFPSLPSSESPRSTKRALLEHFASAEGEKWCQSNLGFELWRRETELRFGSVEQGEWRASWERLKRTLESGDTNWHTMLYLIRCAFAVASSSSASYYDEPDAVKQPPTEDGLRLIKETEEVFRSLMKDSPKAKVERGFLLGLLEIARECRSRGWEEDELLRDLLLAYFDQFSGKMCCFDDLKPYLEVLNPEESRAVYARASEVASKKDNISMDEARRVINALKIVRFLSEEQNIEQEASAAEDYLTRYFSCLPLGEELPPTELQPADDFALLAAQASVSAYHLSNDRSYLERAAALLDHALRSSKYKYQSRILLINIYRLLGASSLSLSHYRTFGVKNIQYDTLSHLILNRGATFAIESGKDLGVHEEAIQTERWYKMGQNEAAQMCVQTFTLPNYGKVEDFAEFRLRVDNSLEKSLSTMEVLRTRLLRGVLDTPQIEQATGDIKKLADSTIELYDNRDFRTLPNFQRRGETEIWDQTALGGRVDRKWLQAFATIYSRFLSPGDDAPQGDVDASTLTRSEAALLTFSAAAQRALVAQLDQAAEAEQETISFFKDQASLFSSSVEDPKTLPWELIQIASISLEAFSLLELGIEQRLDEMAANKLPDQSKHSKRFRALRNSARDGLRQIGLQLMAHSKKVAKERPKIVAAISALKSHEEFTDDTLTNFAHALVESKKTSTEGLAATIHRRTGK